MLPLQINLGATYNFHFTPSSFYVDRASSELKFALHCLSSMEIRGLCHDFCTGECFCFLQFPLEISPSQFYPPAETGLAELDGQGSAGPDTENPATWP